MVRYLRKVIHALLAVGFAAAVPYVDARWLTIAAAVLLAAFVLATFIRKLDSLRAAEKNSHGEFYYALSIFVATLLFLPANPMAFVAATLVLGLADASAAIIGIRWGRHPYFIFGERRSYEGSLTALAVSGIILYTVGVSPLWAFVGGWVLAAAEAIAPRGSDNLVLPLLAGGIVVLFT